VAGLGSIVYGLLESSRLGFKNPSVVAALCSGALFFFLFLFREARTSNPMLPLALFHSRNFSGANLLTFFLYSALGGTLFFLPLNLVQVQGYSPTVAGAALLPFVLLIFLLSRWAGGLVPRYGAKIPLVVGPAVAALGFALFMRPGVGGNFWITFFPAVVTLGLGMAISVAPLTTTVMASVPENHVGLASGINNAISRTGSLMAIAVLGIVMVQSFNRTLDQRWPRMKLPKSAQEVVNQSRTKLAGVVWPNDLDAKARTELTSLINDSFVAGFRRVMAIGVALGAASSLSAWLLITSKPKN